jgi:hypothetical protein
MLKRILPIRHFLIAVILLSSITYAQTRGASGTHLIPRVQRPVLTRQTTATTFQVGDQLTVPAFSFVLIGGGIYQTTTTCRYVGKNVYVFVEDVIANKPQVHDARIAEIAQIFDASTAADPNRGVYDISTDLFGAPPDVDNDPRILIVLLDILDSQITGSTFIGYFDANNQTGQAMREILYVDPLESVSNPPQTLAHEFQHMLHWYGDSDEDVWIDEMCSEYAELACGYKDTTTTAGETFLQAPNIKLTVWEDLPFDFDQVYLFGVYLAQRVGEQVFRPLVSEQLNGVEGLNTSLAKLGKARFEDLFFAWTAATYFDGPAALGYKRIDLGQVGTDTVSTSDRTQRLARLWGADYLVLDQPGRYDVTLESLGDNTVAATLLLDSPTDPGYIVISTDPGTIKTVSVYSDKLTAVAVSTIAGTSESYGLSFKSGTITAESAEAADSDKDRDVDFEDFLRFAGHFNTTADRLGYDPSYDYNTDHQIDFTDFLIFASHFGASF